MPLTNLLGKLEGGSGLAPGGHPHQGSWLAPATSQAYCVPVLARSPVFHNLLPGVLGRTCFCPLPPSSQLALGGNGWPLVLTLAMAPSWNPEEAVQPLCLPQILDPTGEGCTQRRGQDSPLVRPCSTSCFIPGIFFFGIPNSKSGHRCPASLRWETSSAFLSPPSRLPQ